MKNLKDYIIESFEVFDDANNETLNESKEKWYRFIFKDFADSGMEDSIRIIATKSNIYTEPIDGGIKVRIKEGDVDHMSGLIEVITDFVNAHMNDEKHKDAVDKITDTLDKMSEYMEDVTDAEEEKKKKEEEEKAAEEENKED